MVTSRGPRSFVQPWNDTCSNKYDLETDLSELLTTQKLENQHNVRRDHSKNLFDIIHFGIRETFFKFWKQIELGNINMEFHYFIERNIISFYGEWTSCSGARFPPSMN